MIVLTPSQYSALPEVVENVWPEVDGRVELDQAAPLERLIVTIVEPGTGRRRSTTITPAGEVE